MKLPDWLLSTKCYLPILAASIAISPYSEVLAQVYVRGYTKKDGTYVSPHMRSSPGSYGGGSYVPSYRPSSPSSYGGSSYTPSYQPSSPGRNYGAKGRSNGGTGSGTYTSQELTGCRSPSDDEIKKAARGGRVEISGGDCIFIINPKSQDRYRW
jgi:hypothetical protein